MNAIIKTNTPALTIEDPINVFLRRHKSENTRRAYRRDLEDFFTYLLEHQIRPDEVTVAIAEAYIQSKEGECAAMTINRKIATLKSFYKWVVANSVMLKSPFEPVKARPETDRTPTPTLTDEEAMILIEAADISTIYGNADRLVLIFMFCCALRVNEAITIKLQDIRFERDCAVVSVIRKGGNREDVALSDTVYREIQAYVSRFEKLAGRKIEPHQYLIQRQKKTTDKPVGASTIYQNLEKLAAQCEITKKVTPHVCRTTAINQLVEKESDPFRVATAVGHKSITTTMKYYRNRDGLKNSPLHLLDYNLNGKKGETT